jgi:hypothetical protein
MFLIPLWAFWWVRFARHPNPKLPLSPHRWYFGTFPVKPEERPSPCTPRTNASKVICWVPVRPSPLSFIMLLDRARSHLSSLSLARLCCRRGLYQAAQRRGHCKTEHRWSEPLPLQIHAAKLPQLGTTSVVATNPASSPCMSA